MTSTLIRPILSTANVKRLASLSLRSSSSSCYHAAAATSSSCRHQSLPNNHSVINHRRYSSESSSSNGGDQYPTIPTFPWRHSPTPPSRLLQNDDYSGMPNNFRARFVRRLIAAKELNLNFWNVLPLPFGYAQEWEEELAGNFSVAFGLAMRELFETLFGDDGGVVYNDDQQSLSLKAMLDYNNRDTSSDNTTEESFAKNDNTSIVENNNYLNLMMDQLLLQQYQHLHNNHHLPQNNNHQKMSIHLSIKPIKAQLQNIFAVPMLTRDIVASKPHLKGGYQRLERVFKETQSYNEVKQKTYELAEEVGLDSAKRTVIAEATITCLEYFQVKDLESGRIVQGMEDGDEEEEVVHLVRFEMVTDRGEDGKREGGNWKLIDVDDLLEGNVFH
eukprot:scaffold16932_cov145-Skeletonema_marinoi.AAC.3